MKNPCTLDRCWRVEHQAAYAQFGVLRNRMSTVMSLLRRAIKKFTVVVEQCLCEYLEEQRRQVGSCKSGHKERTSATKATAEQMQEALQQLQAQGARIAALETQLRVESARAQTAEQERSTLIQTLVTTLSKFQERASEAHLALERAARVRTTRATSSAGTAEKSGHCWRDCKERRSARDSAGYYLRNEQAETSDASIDEIGALLTEECDSTEPPPFGAPPFKPPIKNGNKSQRKK